jgi:ATP-dependent protease ClpP protease subunit
MSKIKIPRRGALAINPALYGLTVHEALCDGEYVYAGIKKKLELSAKPDKPDETDMYLYGFVTDERGLWDDGDCIATNEVRDMLMQIKGGIINLHINSPGGFAFEGIAIHNLLKQHNAEIHVFIDGLAASAASIIAMAGDRIFMPANTMMMIHKASAITWGTASALRKDADMLDKLDVAVMSSYMHRYTGTEDALGVLLEDETWLTADEAKAMGLCDEVLREPPEPAGNDPPLAPAKIENETDVKPRLRLLHNCLEAFFNGMERRFT